jgi:hypothetical protein
MTGRAASEAGGRRGAIVLRAVLTFAAVALVGADAAFALDVGLSVSQKEIAVGEPFAVTVEVRVEGMGNIPSPTLPEVEGLRQVGRYDSRNFSYVNGLMTGSLVVEYRMVADEPGTYTLGPATAEKGKERARSGTVSVKVLPAGSAAKVPGSSPLPQEDDGTGAEGTDLLVLGSVDDENPYVNEQITYTFTFLRRVRILEGARYTPPTTVGFWVEELDSTEPREVVVDGVRYVAERIRTALFPTGPGEYSIGPSTVVVTVEDRSRRRRRDPFDFFGNDPFGFLRSGREVRLQSDPVVVNVRPLPAAGKPADFSGAVGRFELAATVDRQEVRAGDPVTLTVKLAGEGNVRVVPTPDLSSLEGFKIYDSEASEASHAVGGRIRGEKSWEYVLVPTAGGDVEIPPITLAVFDPEKNAYVTLATAAIPLHVETTDLEDALARGGDLGLAKERVRLRQRDIRYIKPLPASFRQAGSLPITRPTYIALHVVPALAVLAATWTRRRRERLRSDPRYARSVRARKAAERRLRVAANALEREDPALVYSELSSALRGYVADRLHLAAANLDEGTVRGGLERLEVPAEEADDLFDLLEACDSARFSPAAANPEAAANLHARAKAWILKVEKR